jgi:hypothetical protein
MGSTRKGRDVDAALRKKGFRCNAKGDHLFYYFSGASITTKMSHGMMSSSLSADLISRMARQLHLTKKQFLELIDCTLTEEQYRNILSEQDVGVRFII